MPKVSKHMRVACLPLYIVIVVLLFNVVPVVDLSTDLAHWLVEAYVCCCALLVSHIAHRLFVVLFLTWVQR